MKRLPGKHVFPGGFTVKIVVKAEGLDEEGNVASYETLEVGLGQITLHPNRTPRQQWRDLAHELLHALADAQNFIDQRVAP